MRGARGLREQLLVHPSTEECILRRVAHRAFAVETEQSLHQNAERQVDQRRHAVSHDTRDVVPSDSARIGEPGDHALTLSWWSKANGCDSSMKSDANHGT